MAWIKVPPEHHPLFHAALPKDPRVETLQMFGGVAARVNGHLFAGLFGRSTMVWLGEIDRQAALALEGAALFDPMGNGSVRSDKIMLPEHVMGNPAELRRWVARAFATAAKLPPKPKAKSNAKATKPPRANATKRPRAKQPSATSRTAAKRR